MPPPGSGELFGAVRDGRPLVRELGAANCFDSAWFSAPYPGRRLLAVVGWRLPPLGLMPPCCSPPQFGAGLGRRGACFSLG